MKRGLNRREFIQTASAIAAGSIISRRGVSSSRPVISLVLDPDDSVSRAAPVQWATSEFERSLTTRGITVHRSAKLAETQPGNFCVLASGPKPGNAAALLRKLNLSAFSETPEANALAPGNVDGRRVLLACGSDANGLVYSLLDLADRVQNAVDPFEALSFRAPIIERPANSIRGVMRLFASDVEDNPWYNDREMWQQYLTMLATHRFNRFQLSLGLGYDFLRQVTDAYFLFAYPFLLAVPGYQVRASPLPDSERERNLAMLKFISEQTVARGLQFQLGLWMHGYEWIDSPRANYTIEGLTRANHAQYCRDALRLLLQACPAIGGVTLRTHGESGVEEGSYEFWKTIFDGVATCGRRVELDLHPKGLDRTMLDNAISTRQPITVSPKFWAEHLGLPYHQADIRELEVPQAGKQTSKLMNLSEGSRSFMRYGYGDLLREDRSWKVIHRVWPGSQRLLLWGDPMSAAAYSRVFGFCGSNGAEIMEPLSFKGRRGTGIAGNRCAYADAELRPRWDWEKYEYSYRVWGRLLYNPDAPSEVWQRYLGNQFGTRAGDIDAALSSASRMLPLVTTAHLPSAANNNYWPEIYLNHSLIDAAHPGSYSDTPAPKVFGNVSPLDPQLFSRINDYADELLSNVRSGKYSPIEVAQWLEDDAAVATQHLQKAMKQGVRKQTAEFRRLAVDVAMQADLGRFFAAKFRAAVLYRIFEKTDESAPLESALNQYRMARAAWAELADRAKPIYLPDITVGEQPQQHGHWLDRLPAIDRDLEAMAAKLEGAKRVGPSASVARAIKKALGRPARENFPCRHTAPARFVPGQELKIELSVGLRNATVSLYYRHVNQAERFSVVAMEQSANLYRSAIPASYTDSPYPLQYYFEVKNTAGRASLYPGLGSNLMDQPYFVVRRT